MSEANQKAAFTCYLGDGEFDYAEIPLADGEHPTELGDAVDHFIAKYPDRSWRLYERGSEEESPLYEYPGRAEYERRCREADDRHAEAALYFATTLI